MKKATIVFSLLILLSAISFVFWGRDESLNAIVSDSLRPSTVAENDNAYYALLGFKTPPGKDPDETGRRMLAKTRGKDSTSAQFAEGQFADALLKQVSGGEPLPFTENVLSNCGAERAGIVACVIRKRAQVEKALNDNKVLLERYSALIRKQRFADMAAQEGALLSLPFVDLQRAKSALWAKAILQIRDGQIANGLEAVETDAKFWRMLLVQSDTLRVRMVAISVLRGQYELLSQMASGIGNVTATEKDRLLALSKPLTSAELSFRVALTGELRLAVEALAQFEQLSPPSCDEAKDKSCVTNWSLMHPFWRSTPLYRHNATLNRQAELINRWVLLSELPAQQMARQKDLLTQALAKEFKPETYSTFSLYNRIGKQLVASGFADVSNHLLMAHDLDGLIRLVNLQMQIIAFALPDERIGPFVQTSDGSLTNPYTGEAMIWDAKERTLSFPARSREEEVAVTLGKPVILETALISK